MSSPKRGEQLVYCDECGKEYRHCERFFDDEAEIFICPKCGCEYQPKTYECVVCDRKFGEHENVVDNRCEECQRV